MSELPTLMTYTTTSSPINVDWLNQQQGLLSQEAPYPYDKRKDDLSNKYKFITTERPSPNILLNSVEKAIKGETMAQEKRRIIKVFVVDTDNALPLDKAMLYEGEQKFTDLTDQELFFEINIQPLLQKHNDVRAKVLDKKASEKSGKDIYLEPIRIRDLKMVVATMAEF